MSPLAHHGFDSAKWHLEFHVRRLWKVTPELEFVLIGQGLKNLLHYSTSCSEKAVVVRKDDVRSFLLASASGFRIRTLASGARLTVSLYNSFLRPPRTHITGHLDRRSTSEECNQDLNLYCQEGVKFATITAISRT